MLHRDAWNSRKLLTDYLARQLNSGRLALFLGAGISRFYGLPQWDRLVANLFAQKGEVPQTGTLLREAENFRDKHYAGNDLGWVAAVKAALYQDASADFEKIRINPTLAALGALVMNSTRGSAGHVVTFNYDDLLERYLEYHGFTTRSVWQECHWTERADATILHPHGFLPSGPGKTNSAHIVLDQMSYSEVVGNSSLPWFQEIASVLRTHTCLFIGLSGDDNNLDALLLHVRESHASKMDGSTYGGVAFSTEDRKSFFDKRGIYNLIISNYDNDLPSFLLGICQQAAVLRCA